MRTRSQQPYDTTFKKWVDHKKGYFFCLPSHPQYLRFDELSEEREASSLFYKQSVLLGLAEGPEGVGPAAGNLGQRPGIET